ncbi:unknown [Sutterella wadsworthensis CAG:135]|nr:unknown [Sutterella wadsworthensis CAG:135]
MIVIDVAVPHRISLGLHDLIELLDLSLKRIGLDAGSLGKIFKRVVLLNDLTFKHAVEQTRTLFLQRPDIGFIADSEALAAISLFNHDRIGANLAVGELIDEACAVRIHPKTIFSGSRLIEHPANAHALFTRAAPRAALNPVVLNLKSADG